jgi:hypothetical protein
VRRVAATNVLRRMIDPGRHEQDVSPALRIIGDSPSASYSSRPFEDIDDLFAGCHACGTSQVTPPQKRRVRRTDTKV